MLFCFPVDEDFDLSSRNGFGENDEFSASQIDNTQTFHAQGSDERQRLGVE